MKNLARYLIIFLASFFLIGFTLGASFIWDAFLRTPGRGAPEIVISITEGDNVKGISLLLQKDNLIPSRFAFEMYVRLSRTERLFQPGDFTLDEGMSYAAIVSALTSAVPDEVTVVFPEGLNLEQMTGRVEKAFGAGWGNRWLQSLDDKKWSEIYSFISDDSLEGYLFPDTYKVSRNGFPDSLTFKLLTNFSEKLSPELRVEISRQSKTIQQILTLASIVEREVRGDEDRAKVADLFWRRLEAGMALQADSTVHYVVGNDGDSAYTSGRDRSVDSPYNTYLYPGLPPGPICNPSLSSIKAVIYPIANEAWYFLTDSEGSVHYARTNDEQNTNKVLYLK
ncbi:MAG: endolytic transglycosylase MltG [Candidatus Uhrbacteria bacterium]